MAVPPQVPPGYDPLQDKIEVVDYDVLWPGLFHEEKTILHRTLGFVPGLTVEHFGSTSVLGLAAKPIIDIMVGVASRDAWISLIEPLQNLGYVFWDGNPKEDEMFFVKGLPPFGKGRTHHLHIYDLRGPRWNKELLFRDYLRAQPEAARPYEKLKRELAARFTYDREAYTDAKTDFIEGILRKINHQ